MLLLDLECNVVMSLLKPVVDYSEMLCPYHAIIRLIDFPPIFFEVYGLGLFPTSQRA